MADLASGTRLQAEVARVTAALEALNVPRPPRAVIAGAVKRTAAASARRQTARRYAAMREERSATTKLEKLDAAAEVQAADADLEVILDHTGLMDVVLEFKQLHAATLAARDLAAGAQVTDSTGRPLGRVSMMHSPSPYDAEIEAAKAAQRERVALERQVLSAHEVTQWGDPEELDPQLKLIDLLRRKIQTSLEDRYVLENYYEMLQNRMHPPPPPPSAPAWAPPGSS